VAVSLVCLFVRQTVLFVSVHGRKLGKNIGRAQVRASGTRVGLQPAHSQKPCWGGHRRGLDSESDYLYVSLEWGK